jgi:hypothetical protein
MGIIDLLMKKYNLPESVVKKVHDAVYHHLMFKQIPTVKAKTKADNQQAVDRIRWADFAAMVNPEKPGEGLFFCPEISAVKFIINGETVTIDDPQIIAKLSRAVWSQDLPITPKRKRGGQFKPENVPLKTIIQELMNYCPDNYLPHQYKKDSAYTKRVFAGHVLREYLTMFEKQDDDVLQDSIRNLLK